MGQRPRSARPRPHHTQPQRKRRHDGDPAGARNDLPSTRRFGRTTRSRRCFEATMIKSAHEGLQDFVAITLPGSMADLRGARGWPRSCSIPRSTDDTVRVIAGIFLVKAGKHAELCCRKRCSAGRICRWFFPSSAISAAGSSSRTHVNLQPTMILAWPRRLRTHCEL
jgi:hypothetical protein